MKKLIIIALIITSAVLLFPLKMLVLTFDLGFITEFTAGWNHRIREMIQAERISYSQGMMLIFNTDMTINVMRRAVLALTLWLLSILSLITLSLNTHKKVLINGILVFAIIISAPLVIVPLLLMVALILFNIKNKTSLE